MTTMDAPRTALPTRRRAGMNLEKWGWIFMRASGVLLLVLIFGHLFVNLLTGEGIKALDFAFVGGKWSDPFWQIWDCAMLWLALIHGANGMRTIVNDYAHNRLNHDSNSHAHQRASIIGASETVPIVGGRLALGTWQALVLIDFDDRPRARTVFVQVTA